MTQPSAKVSQLMRGSAAEAFDAFVDPVRITQFWLAATSAPLSEGADVTWQFMVPDATERTRVTELKRPHRIAFNWSDGVSVRLDFEALSRRDATRLTAGARHKPEVAGVFKGDVVAADGWMTKQSRALTGNWRERKKTQEYTKS